MKCLLTFASAVIKTTTGGAGQFGALFVASPLFGQHEQGVIFVAARKTHANQLAKLLTLPQQIPMEVLAQRIRKN